MKIECLNELEKIEDEILESCKCVEKEFDFSGVSECNHCYFEKIEFTDAHFENISCYDVVFKNCDFSNVIWNQDTTFTGPAIHSVTFDNCKMVGTDFGMCSLKKVKFQNCVGRYVNFSFATLKEVTIDSCSFYNMILQDTTCKKLILKECELEALEILHTSLYGVDFTTDQIDGMKTDLESIRGAIVSSNQALSLSQLLGIVVK